MNILNRNEYIDKIQIKKCSQGLQEIIKPHLSLSKTRNTKTSLFPKDFDIYDNRRIIAESIQLSGYSRYSRRLIHSKSLESEYNKLKYQKAKILNNLGVPERRGYIPIPRYLPKISPKYKI